MVNMKSNILIAACAVIVLAGCQGQNPFKRQTNPVRDYPKVNDSIIHRKGVSPYGTNLEQKPEPDNSQYICSGPFIVESDRVLTFMEGSATQFEIKITNRLGDDFTISAIGLPEGAELRLLKRLNEKAAIYQISWTPKIPPGESALTKNLSLNLRSAALGERCQGAMATENFTLLAVKSKDRPTISISGLPQTPISYGDQVNFTVEVSDRTAAPNQPPFLGGFQFSAQAQSGERLVIDGSTAVGNCEVTPAYNAQTERFIFNCTFFSTLLEKGPDKSLIGSGKIAEAVFFVKAKSTVSQQDSHLGRGSVRIQFPKQGAKK